MTIFLQNYQIFAAFRQLSRKFSDFVFYSPPFPPHKGGTCPPPPGGPKTTHPSAETWRIPLPVADPTPTYDRGGNQRITPSPANPLSAVTRHLADYSSLAGLWKTGINLSRCIAQKVKMSLGFVDCIMEGFLPLARTCLNAIFNFACFIFQTLISVN